MASIAAALDFIISEATKEESQAWNFAAWMSEVMQCDVKYVGEEPYAPKVRFA